MKDARDAREECTVALAKVLRPLVSIIVGCTEPKEWFMDAPTKLVSLPRPRLVDKLIGDFVSSKHAFASRADAASFVYHTILWRGLVALVEDCKKEDLAEQATRALGEFNELRKEVSEDDGD